MSTRAKPRCSFCGSLEHKRPTCPSHLTILEQNKQNALELRKKMADAFSEMGIMSGALVKVELYDNTQYRWKYELCMIESVDWARVYRESSRVINILSLKDGKRRAVERSDILMVSPMPHQNCLEYNHSLMEETNKDLIIRKPALRKGS